jgi:hypothetical protein
MGGVTIDFGRRRPEKEAATLIIFETADVRKGAPCTQITFHPHRPDRVGLGHIFGCQ